MTDPVNAVLRLEVVFVVLLFLITGAIIFMPGFGLLARLNDGSPPVLPQQANVIMLVNIAQARRSW
jgi:hypothetical protein